MIGDRTYTMDEIEERTGFDRRTIAYYVQQGVLPKVGRRGPRTRYSQLFLDRLDFIRMVRDLQDRGAIGQMTLSDFRRFFDSVPEETIADLVGGREPLDIVNRMASLEAAAMASPSERKRAMTGMVAGRRRSVDGGPEVSRLIMPVETTQEWAPKDKILSRYAALSDHSRSESADPAADGDTPSGKHHRLTLDAIETETGAPETPRMSAPPPPVEDELSEALARLNAVVRRQPRAYLRTSETWTRARISDELALSARGLDQRHLPLLERVAQILRRLMRDGEGGF